MSSISNHLSSSSYRDVLHNSVTAASTLESTDLRLQDLPQDIVNLIFKTLSHSHKPKIKCGALCRSFFRASLMTLFSTLRIDREKDRCRRLPCLKRLLFACSEIIADIQSLHFTGFAPGTEHGDHDFDQFLLRSLIEQRSLRALHIQRVAWSTLHPETQSLIFDLIRSCPLRTISVDICCPATSFPVHIFGEVPTLRNLRFMVDSVWSRYNQGCWHNVSPSAEPPFPLLPKYSRKTFLDSIHIGGTSARTFAQYISCQNCPLRVTRLREFVIHGVGEDECFALSTITKLAGNSIKSLVWNSTKRKQSDMSIIPPRGLQELSSLRSLTVITHVDCQVNRALALLSSQVRIQANQLEELKLFYCGERRMVKKKDFPPWFGNDEKLQEMADEWTNTRRYLQDAMKNDDVDFFTLHTQFNAFPKLERIRIFMNQNEMLRAKYPPRWIPSRHWIPIRFWIPNRSWQCSEWTRQWHYQYYYPEAQSEYESISELQYFMRGQDDYDLLMPPCDDLPISGDSEDGPGWVPSMHGTGNLCVRVGKLDIAREILENTSFRNHGFWSHSF